MNTWIVSIPNPGSISGHFTMPSGSLYVFFIMRRGNRIFKYKGYVCKKSVYLQTHGVSLEGDIEVITSGGDGAERPGDRENSLFYVLVYGLAF